MCLPKPWNLVRAYAVGHSLCQSSPTDLGQWWLSECCRYRFASRGPQVGKRRGEVEVYLSKCPRRVLETEKADAIHQPVLDLLRWQDRQFLDARMLQCPGF